MKRKEEYVAQFSVRALPYYDHETRRRAGRIWPVGQTVIVRVVDQPSEANEVTPTQIETLKADRLFEVKAVDGIDWKSPAVVELKRELAAKASTMEAELAALELQKAALRAENAEIKRRAREARDLEEKRVAELMAVIAKVRAERANK